MNAPTNNPQRGTPWLSAILERLAQLKNWDNASIIPEAFARKKPELTIGELVDQLQAAIDKNRRDIFSGAPMNVYSGTCTTASTSTAATTATVDNMAKALELLESMKPEPFGEWMRARGCPPEVWDLFLPWHMQHEHGPMIWPPYVKFSLLVDQALCVRRQAMPDYSTTQKGGTL